MTNDLRRFLKVPLVCLIVLSTVTISKADEKYFSKDSFLLTIQILKDTGVVDTAAKDSIDTAVSRKILRRLNRDDLEKRGSKVNLKLSGPVPFLSLQQLMKGKAAGLYIQENNGEPGSVQNMIIRGLSSPIFSNKDNYNVQPAVYINGIPMIQDHPFAYEIQQYGYNRIGPYSNLLAGINLDNISSIEIVKDPLELAKLGPLAVNGAIWINMKNARSGKTQISLDSYFGMAQRPTDVLPVNAAYENDFRQQFYKLYGTDGQQKDYPNYLKDQTNPNYYGPSQWPDIYYRTAPLYNLNFAFSSGSDRANFRFVAGRTSEAGNADKTSFNRNNAAFYINMAPFTWLNFSSMISGSKTDRNRNRSFRDRYAETQYLPDLTSPIPPSKSVYQSFLNEYEKAIDENTNNGVQGYVSAQMNSGNLKFSTTLAFDYSEGIRDVFWPSTIMETSNYVSNYFGYNQRAMWNNTLSYDFNFNEDHKLRIEATGNLQDDVYQYNYAKAYNGPNDYIKVNASDGDFIVYRYTDKERLRLLSGAGTFRYGYKDLFDLNAVLRTDGASNLQRDNRWLFTPAFSAKWHLKNQFFRESKSINALSAGISWARVGKLISSDRISAGPQYVIDLGWGGQPAIPSYNGVTGLSRPYSSGWLGYNVAWPYAERMELSLDASFFNRRLNASLSVYNNNDKQQLINIPVPSEYGYTSKIVNGMDVNNRGIELTIDGNILPMGKSFGWATGINISANRNRLSHLPNGVDEIVVGDRKLKVGEPIDRFYVYENKGIYNSRTDVPVDANNKLLNFNGVSFDKGDPIWRDTNGDFTINDNDKVLKGNAMPLLTGGLLNQFRYKKFDLSFQLYFALGQKALNNRAANKFNFTGNKNLNNVDEIFFWQQDVDVSKYPIYNPWSDIGAYRPDQDIFLENASYLKLRSATLGYHFTWGAKQSNSSVSQKRTVYFYLAATNLFTITNFSGSDPELVDFNGYYTGYSLPIARTITLGLKANL